MTTQVSNPLIGLRESPIEYCLAAQQVEALDCIADGGSIICTHGLLWVTLEGDREDYLLREGDIFAAGRPGMLLIQALNEVACWRFAG